MLFGGTLSSVFLCALRMALSSLSSTQIFGANKLVLFRSCAMAGAVFELTSSSLDPEPLTNAHQASL